MTGLTVRPPRDNLGFGARVGGVTHATLADADVRDEIDRVLTDRGMIVFEDVEPSGAMHVAISNVFGPLEDHPGATVARVDADVMPGVIDMRSDPGRAHVVEVGGRRVATWLPWHFDHCYNDELRAIDIPAEGPIPPVGRAPGDGRARSAGRRRGGWWCR